MEISVWTCCFDILHHSALFFQPFIYHFFSLGSANFTCQWNLAFLLNIYWGHQEISIEDWDHIKSQFHWLAKIHIFLLFLHSITQSLVTDRHLFGKIKYCTYHHDPLSFNMIRSKADDSWRVLVIFGTRLKLRAACLRCLCEVERSE